MKYLLAGAATGLLFAAAAIAQPVAPVGGAVEGAVGSTAGPLGAGGAGTTTSTIQPPPTPSPDTASGRELPVDTRADDRLKPAVPNTSDSGTVDATTPGGGAKAKGKARTSGQGASSSDSISTGN